MTKFLKSALKTPKTNNDESLSIVTKDLQQSSIAQSCPLTISSMSKSMTISNDDSPQLTSSDLSNELVQRKSSMSTSLYSSFMPSNNNEQKDTTESIASSASAVSARTGKVPLGTRVLPVFDPNADAPPIKLRHFQPEKKGR